MTDLELKIYEIVKRIPEGKVCTYGQIACALGNKNLSRVVGNAMHKNPYPFVALAAKAGYKGDCTCYDITDLVPCHRVVDSKGHMGKNFGLGGIFVQAKMLEIEGVVVCDYKVDLGKYLWSMKG